MWYLIFLLLLTLPAMAKRYAVVVNGGDTKNTIQGRHMSRLAQQSRDLYEKLGYEVIVLDSNQGSNSQHFNETLGRLQNVEELQLSFYSHGLFSSKKDEEVDPNRFPVSSIRADEAINGDESKHQSEGTFSFYLAGSVRDKIGLGDLRSSLAQLKSRNPQMRTTIQNLACYGGNTVRGLESIPDVQVFSATDSARQAKVLHPLGYLDPDGITYPEMYLEELKKGKSFLEAHLAAKVRYVEGTVLNTEIFALTVPQSSLDVFFAEYCLSPKEAACETDIAPQVTELASQVIQVELHSQISQSLRIEQELWNRTEARLCSPELRNFMVPRELLMKVVAATQSSTGTIPLVSEKPIRTGMQLLDFTNEMSESARSRFKPWDQVRSELLTQCPLDVTLPQARTHQFACFSRVGNKDPILAFQMFSETMGEVESEIEKCDLLDREKKKNEQLRACLRDLPKQMNDQKLNRLVQLLQQGQRSPR